MPKPEITEGSRFLPPEAVGLDALNGFKRDCKIAEAAFAHCRTTGEAFEFDAIPPEVIGFVPRDERKYFDGQRYTDSTSRFMSNDDLDDFLKSMPGLRSEIERDLSRLGVFRMTGGKYERRFTEKGKFPRTSTNWHFDIFEEGKYTPQYLIRNRFPMQSYSGPVAVRPLETAPNRLFFVNRPSEDSPFSVAPEYGIIRLAPFSTHRTSPFGASIDGAFMKITTTGK